MGGWFLMSEVPLDCVVNSGHLLIVSIQLFRGTSLIRNTQPVRTNTGP